MLEDLAYKRRAALEQELEAQYEGRLIRLPDQQVVRVQTIGVEWQGKFSFTVIIHGNNRRSIWEYTDFKQQTQILR